MLTIFELSVLERIYTILQTYFFLEAVPIFTIYVRTNLSDFRKKKMQLECFRGYVLCHFTHCDRICLYISTPIAFYMGHMPIFNMILNVIYPKPPQLSSVHGLLIDILLKPFYF